MNESNKVLIVEDEKPMAHALEMKLKSEGFEVEVANNGNQAVEKIQQNDFILVLLDLIMPNMDGFDVLKSIQEQGKNLRVVVLSNLSQEGDMQKAKELGASEYFIKSNTSIADLVSYVKSLAE